MAEKTLVDAAGPAKHEADLPALLAELSEPDANNALLEKACELALNAGELEKHRPRGVDVARTLNKLGVDQPSLLAALLSDPALRESLPPGYISKEFGPKIERLVSSVNRLNTFEGLGGITRDRPGEADKLRRMLLAITDDLRAVLIKLAYRLERLKIIRHASFDERRSIAAETLEIFAPIANWLGIGQLKWELEDLAFRYLEPQTYKRIVDLLEEKRDERNHYVRDFTSELSRLLEEQGIKAEVSGRPKHIVSIWRKMQRKRLEFHELFDVRAVRVLVDTVADCYSALGAVHTSWKHIPKEFDDYIANPKENGYQSLHTAVIGPQGKIIEIQIRTHDMHTASEQGAASHWRYKQGAGLEQAMERNISHVRNLLEQVGKEDGEELLDSASGELFHDRVYVFTPAGQVIDLPTGSTPLDFAYAIHTEVGHRCRGAKVNGHIVPLTYQLQSGERVEILTTKEGGPSRDWMNRNLGYIRSANARSRVRAWFNQQDFNQNVQDGRGVLERTFRRVGVHDLPLERLVGRSGRKDTDSLLADLGRGQVTPAQLSAWIHDLQAPDEAGLVTQKSRRKLKPSSGEIVRVRGVGKLLTHMAQCCRPLPGDPIIGYITLGKGVTVHRNDCPNILALKEEKKQRLIEVEWGDTDAGVFPVEIQVVAFDRTGLLHDITSILANEKVNLIGANTHTNPDDQMASFRLTVEVDGLEHLGTLMDRIAQLPNVFEVGRGAASGTT